MDTNSGQIWNKVPLENLSMNRYELNVIAVDGGRPSLLARAQVVLIIDNYSGNISEMVAEVDGTLVLYFPLSFYVIYISTYLIPNIKYLHSFC